MRIAMAQLNPIVGDVAGNTRLVLEAIDAARAGDADVLVCSECALVGYPPRDLLLREGVVEECERAAAQIAEYAGDLTVLVGHPRLAAAGQRPFHNSVSVCQGGRVTAVYDKRLLPGYDVFDEDRYFEPGASTCIVDIAGWRTGIVICEDLWRAHDVEAACRYPIEPVRETCRSDCDLLISLNASPFVIGKWKRHIAQLREIAREHDIPVVSVNQVGANDDLIFDGRSLAMNRSGEIVSLLPGWQAATTVVDLQSASPIEVDSEDGCREIYEALVLGLRDYCCKTRNKSVVLGLSGGVDSALTACIAASALGAANVHGLIMPSHYSASMSSEDARELARNIGMRQVHEVPIEQPHLAVHATLAPTLRDKARGITDENIQARLRGLLLMAYSNAKGGLVLSTSNKSEMAVGYSTLYGDMCGAVAVIGDVLKTDVYKLSRWLNDNFAKVGFDRPPIPQRSITRPPSAELRPNQTDQDSLPPYEQLDELVRRYIEHEQSADRIIAETKLDATMVRRMTRLIDAMQYKKDQAAVILKISPRAFGRGRPMPIVMEQTGVMSKLPPAAEQIEAS